MDFLESELGALPPGAKRAILKEIENAVRAARAATYHDDPANLSERCTIICNRIGTILEFGINLRKASSE